MSIFDVPGPVIMGILNVTPDSFSDGGQFIQTEKAVDHALQMIEEGAQIIDIGGESTRPGAAPVSQDEEIDRVLPVIEKLKNSGVLLSIDTYHAKTMEAAVRAGVGMINDITALRGDEKSAAVVAKAGVYLCLMHMQGDSPRDMQKNPSYNNVVQEVSDFLSERIAFCMANGIEKKRLIVDPGIGFGKRIDHNLSLLRGVSEFTKMGVPAMIGVSKKSFIGQISGGAEPDQRLPGSLSAALWCLQQGVKIFRVHDVKETRQAMAVHQAICAIV